MLQQMVTDPRIMVLICFQNKPTFTERTWFWPIFWVCGDHGKVWDFHAWTTLRPRTLVVCVFFPCCAPNVSNLSQAVWPKVVLNRNHWHYASTQTMSSVEILVLRNCHGKMQLVAEPRCVAKTWQQQWVAGRERQWTNVVSWNNHGNPSESRSDLISCHLFLAKGLWIAKLRFCSHHYHLNPWRWQSSVGNGKVSTNPYVYSLPIL